MARAPKPVKLKSQAVKEKSKGKATPAAEKQKKPKNRGYDK